MSDQSDSVFLQVYNVIKFDSPSNEIYHEKRFLVEYIDNIKLKLINIENNEESLLLFNSDMSLQDESILSITIISRGSTDGYATQNKLLPNTWVDVHFGGEVPSSITGQITNLEEDMIEITLFQTEDTIYIDFAYKGIPEELFIEEIKIRQAPSIMKDLSPQKESHKETLEQDHDHDDHRSHLPQLDHRAAAERNRLRPDRASTANRDRR